MDVSGYDKEHGEISEPEDVPDDFFDDFSNKDFMAGLDIVDAWEDGNRQNSEHYNDSKLYGQEGNSKQNSRLLSYSDERMSVKEKIRSSSRGQNSRICSPSSKVRLSESPTQKNLEETRREITQDMERVRKELAGHRKNLMEGGESALQSLDLGSIDALIERTNELCRSRGADSKSPSKGRTFRSTRSSSHQDSKNEKTQNRRSRSPISRTHLPSRRRRSRSRNRSRTRNRSLERRGRYRRSRSVELARRQDIAKKRSFLEEIRDKLNEIPHPMPIDPNLINPNMGPMQNGGMYRGANMGGPNISLPNMGVPNMVGHIMGGSNIAGPSMGGPNMTGPNISGPNLCGPNMGGSNMGGPSMVGPNIGGNPYVSNSIGPAPINHPMQPMVPSPYVSVPQMVPQPSPMPIPVPNPRTVMQPLPPGDTNFSAPFYNNSYQLSRMPSTLTSIPLSSTQHGPANQANNYQVTLHTPNEMSNMLTTNSAIENLNTNKKISLSDMLAMAAKPEVRSSAPWKTMKKQIIMERCQQALKELRKYLFDGDFSAPFIVDMNAKTPLKMKLLQSIRSKNEGSSSTHISPLKKAPIIRFQYTTSQNTHGMRSVNDTYMLTIDRVLRNLGFISAPIDLDEDYDSGRKSERGTEDEPACATCRYRSSKMYANKATQCTPDKPLLITTGCQVYEDDLRRKKNESLARLTPAQLAQTSKQNLAHLHTQEDVIDVDNMDFEPSPYARRQAEKSGKISHPFHGNFGNRSMPFMDEKINRPMPFESFEPPDTAFVPRHRRF